MSVNYSKHEPHFHDAVQGVVIGDNNTVTLTYQTGEQVIRPFLAPPLPPYDLIGRDGLLYDLKQRLFAGGSLGLSALNGLPGVGKTALAIALAHDREIIKQFRDGILWAGLGRNPDVFEQFRLWGDALGIPSSKIVGLNTIEDRQEIIRAEIGMRRMLLVIDDAWSTEAALMFKLGGVNCAHIVTTRLPEVALRFANASTTVRELNNQDGLTLLKQLASNVIEAESNEVQELVKVVGGLPLALILMGNYLKVQSYSEQPRRIRAALDRLRQAEKRWRLQQPQEPPYHPSLPPGAEVSLRTAIAISDEALDEIAQNALRALSVFPPKPNTFSEEAALAITEVPAEALDTLCDFGLLEGGGPGRYTLHQTIAEYAKQHLTDDKVYRRMAAFFANYVDVNKGELGKLDREHGNILEAAEVAQRTGDGETFIHIIKVLTIDGYFDARGHTPLFLERLDMAIETARKQGESQKETLHYLLGKRGNAYLHRGNLRNQLQCYQEALNLAKELKLLDRQIVLSIALSGIRCDLGEVEAAETDLQNAYQLALTTQETHLIAMVLEYQGYVAYYGRKDYLAARDFYTQAVEYAKYLDDHPVRQFHSWLGIGAAEHELRCFTQAVSSYQKALEIARAANNLIWEANVLFALGGNCHALNEADHSNSVRHREQAQQYFSEAIAHFRQIGGVEKFNEVISYMEDRGYSSQD